MMKFSFLIAILLSMQCRFIGAADRTISIDEHLFDLALHHDPLLDHTIVYALSLVNKNLSVIAAATKDVRREKLEEAILRTGYSIFRDGYNSGKKGYDPGNRALYFYAQSSLAVAIMAYNERAAGSFYSPKPSDKQSDFGCMYAYASDGDIKVVMASKMIMCAKTGKGISMGCDRGIPFLHLGFSDIGPIINGPLVELKQNYRSISLIYRDNPCDDVGDKHEYVDEQKIENHGIFSGIVKESHQETVSPISKVKKYIEDQRRPWPKM